LHGFVDAAPVNKLRPVESHGGMELSS